MVEKRLEDRLERVGNKKIAYRMDITETVKRITEYVQNNISKEKAIYLLECHSRGYGKSCSYKDGKETIHYDYSDGLAIWKQYKSQFVFSDDNELRAFFQTYLRIHSDSIIRTLKFGDSESSEASIEDISIYMFASVYCLWNEYEKCQDFIIQRQKHLAGDFAL